jgi:hypothetical protein
MVWLTSLVVHCCEGFSESCSIFSLTPFLLCGRRLLYHGTCSMEV